MMRKFNFITTWIALVLLLSACTSGLGAQATTPAGGTPSEAPPTLTVTGSGRVYVTPDIAYINIGVHTEGKSASQALRENNDLTARVVEAIKALGVEDQDIQTSNFNIYPQEQFTPEGQPTGEIKYVVDNTVYVTVRDLSKLGEILDAAVQAGANNVYGIQFDLSDSSTAMNQARKLAVEDAHKTATTLAEAAQVKLGKILSISTYGGAVPAPYVMGKGGGGYAAAEVAVPVSPGQMVITVEVNLVFEISQ